MLGNEKKKAAITDRPLYRIHIISPVYADTLRETERNRTAALQHKNRVCRKMGYLLSDEKSMQPHAYAVHGYIDMLLDGEMEPERQIIEQLNDAIIRICDAIAIGGSIITADMQKDLHSAIATHSLPILLIGDRKHILSGDERQRLFSAIRICTDADTVHVLDISDVHSKSGTVWHMQKNGDDIATEQLDKAGAIELLKQMRG